MLVEDWVKTDFIGETKNYNFYVGYIVFVQTKFEFNEGGNDIWFTFLFPKCELIIFLTKLNKSLRNIIIGSSTTNVIFIIWSVSTFHYIPIGWKTKTYLLYMQIIK